MGFFSKEEKTSKQAMRVIKTLFFLTTLLFSFLLVSAPVFLIIADTILPSAILSSSLPLQNLSSHLANYDFRSSLVDIPLISIFRSLVILCVYSFCDGPRLSNGPYLAITTMCSLSSLVFVSLKASFVFEREGTEFIRISDLALFVCSIVLAVGHVVIAYRISCRERRKLLVYKIDIEAVSACKNGFPRYQKLVKEERVIN